MKKIFVITLSVIFTLSMNLYAVMQPIDLGKNEIPDIAEFETELGKIVLGDQACSVLEDYYSQAVNLLNQNLDEVEFAKAIAPIAVNAAKDILSYGVNIEVLNELLKTLMQNSKLNSSFSILFNECNKHKLVNVRTIAPRKSFIDSRVLVRCIFSVFVVLAIVYLLQNIPGVGAASGEYKTRISAADVFGESCQAHHNRTNCPVYNLYEAGHNGEITTGLQAISNLAYAYIHQLFLGCPCWNEAMQLIEAERRAAGPR